MIGKRFKGKNKRGVTLVEIIVGTACALLIAGIVLGIFISTNSASDKSESRVILYSEGRIIDRQVFDILQKRINDAEIVKPGANQVSFFKGDELRVLSSTSDSSGTIELISIKTKTAEDGKSSFISMTVQSYNNETGELLPVSEKAIGTQKDRVSAKIFFNYASEFDGLEPKFVDAVDNAGGVIPKLVKYSIMLEDKKKSFSPVVLSSSIAFN